MPHVDTGRSVADMVYDFALWDGTIDSLPCVSMCILASIVNRHDAVSFIIFMTCPDEAFA